MLVSDKGACFISAESTDFMSKNVIKRVTSAPFRSLSTNEQY